MKPEILLDGRAEIWRADCLTALPLVQAGGVRHVICDPPYEAHMHEAKRAPKNSATQRRIRIDGRQNPKNVDFASIDGLREPLMLLVKGCCDGWFVAFCTPEGVAAWRDAIEKAKFRYKRACFWVKPDSAPQLNGQGPAFAVEPFVTAWCGRGVSRWNGGGRRNWFMHPTNGADREGTHVTEKSLALMMEIVALFTNPGDLVIDPFMGSGTTGVAAVALGRRFVGIEKDPKHYALAKGRLQSTFMGKTEGRALIAKLTGSDRPGPLFGGADAAG